MATPEGERRIVSVLFADVAGSTAIAERLGPERTKFLMDDVVRLMAAQVRELDGTVAQLLGDGLLALFGAPVAHEDDAERAVRAALGLRDAVADYAGEVAAAYGIELGVRTAVNTGPVVVASEVEDGRERWNALGDTVNVAARLQSLATPDTVVVGESTARLVEHAFALDALGPQSLRGRSDEIDAHVVRGEIDEPERGASGSFVGRDFELTVLERTLDGLAEGRGVIIGITGEAGIGKTRLIAQAHRRFAGRVRVLEGRGLSFTAGSPYAPIRELLRCWLGVDASAPEAHVRLELRTQLGRLTGERASELYPFLGSVLGISLEPAVAAVLRETGRESVQEQTFAAVHDLAVALSDELPLCIVLEDLHWADEATLELVEALLGVTEEAAVGLVLVHRSERDHRSWRLGERARQLYPHRLREIELRPLPADASRELAGELAGAPLPEEVAFELAARSGGNPFFLEAALRDLVERGALERQNGRWTLAVDASALAIPAEVQGALQARLDRLDPGARELIGVAAVVGRSFELGLMQRLLPGRDLTPALSELQRLDLIVEERRRPAHVLRFRHGLVQEVAYASLLDRRRRELHARVAQALVDQHEGACEEIYGQLARHYAEADDAEAAARWLLAAGDAARAVAADREALSHYRRAHRFLARLGDDARMRETLFKIALVHHLAFDFARAEEAYDEAFCCRVDEETRLAATQRVEIAEVHPRGVVPGDVYTTHGLAFVSHLFRGLLRLDRELNVMPELASNFRVSHDGLTYLFQLREGLRWSDGEPCTADDFVYTWARMRKERQVTSFLMDDVASATALDDTTLEVRLHSPNNAFPYKLASPYSFPWPQHCCEAHGDDWRDPEHLVGNGPYVLESYTEEGAIMRANPHWVGARGNVGEIAYVFSYDHEMIVRGWREGRFDIAHASDAELSELPDTWAERLAALGTVYAALRSDAPALRDPRVRRAIAHAIDRDQLVDNTTRLLRPSMRGGLLPPGVPGHSVKVGAPYDPERARALLAEAGHENGRGLPPIRLAVGGWLTRVAERLEEQLALVGIQLERVLSRSAEKPHPLPLMVREDASADIWLTAWNADFPDPDGFFRGMLEVHDSWPTLFDEELCGLLGRARTLADQDARLRLYQEADRLLVAERATMLPIGYPRMDIVLRPWLEGVGLNPLTLVQLDRAVVSRPAERAEVIPEPEASPA